MSFTDHEAGVNASTFCRYKYNERNSPNTMDFDMFFGERVTINNDTPNKQETNIEKEYNEWQYYSNNKHINNKKPKKHFIFFIFPLYLFSLTMSVYLLFHFAKCNLPMIFDLSISALLHLPFAVVCIATNINENVDDFKGCFLILCTMLDI